MWDMMKRPFPFLTSVFLFLGLVQSGHAQNQSNGSQMNLDAGTTAVQVECNFRNTNKVSCQEFMNDFFSKYSSIIHRENNFEAAAITLLLTDEAVTEKINSYTFDWRSKDQTEVSDFKYSQKIDQTSLDEISILTELTKHAGAGLSLFFDVKTIEDKNGQLVVVYQPKDAGNQPAHKDGFYDRLQKSPIYLDLGLNGGYNSQGRAPYDSQSFGGTTYGELGYLKDKYKVDLSGYYSYKKSTIPTGDGYLNSETNKKGFAGLFVYSMARKWSVAVMNTENVDENSNIKMKTGNSIGVEYALVPFRSTENHELSFRVGTGYNTLRLGDANELGNLSEKYFSAFAKIYFYWVLNDSKVSIKMNAGIDENLKYHGYEKFSGGTTLNFQLSRAMSLSLNGEYSYSANSLTYPQSPDLSNPLQSQMMSGMAGKTITMSVGLSYTIGNSLRKTRDRRWAN